MELNQQRIEDAIVAEVVDKFMGEDELYNRVKVGVEARIDKLWAEVVKERIATEVNASIQNAFEREYCRIDQFGNRSGAPTTIRAELERLIGGYWNEKVTKEGKTAGAYDSGSVTRAEWLMAKMCADDFNGAMKQHIVNVAGSVKDHFRAELNKTVARMLSEVFHVKSLGDQGKGTERSSLDPVAKPVSES